MIFRLYRHWFCRLFGHRWYTDRYDHIAGWTFCVRCGKDKTL